LHGKREIEREIEGEIERERRHKRGRARGEIKECPRKTLQFYCTTLA